MDVMNMANKILIFILTVIFINTLSTVAFSNENSLDKLSYEYVYLNINNKQFLQNYPYHVTNFTYHNYIYYDIKKDFNKINKIMKCMAAIYDNNLNWHDIVSKINYYREMAVLSNIISRKTSIQYHKKFLYIVYKAEECLISGKLNAKNLSGEVNTYKYTAIKIISEQETNVKSSDKPKTIIELQKTSNDLKAKLFDDKELNKDKDINNLY